MNRLLQKFFFNHYLTFTVNKPTTSHKINKLKMAVLKLFSTLDYKKKLIILSFLKSKLKDNSKCLSK